MSLKPTKKTDLGKQWLKDRSLRSTRIQIHPEYHLIVTEGTKTEPKYFNAIKEEINKSFKDRITLEVIGGGDNTINLFTKAKGIAEKSPNGFKHVWIVYDTDEFTKENINKTKENCINNSTEETEYHAIWSNQCIELWFLLHFSFFQSDIDRKGYFPKLTVYLNSINAGDYAKDREDIYDILKPYLPQAIRYAEKLAKINQGRTPSDSAPGTEVYQIINKLKPYLDF